jgi:hypothetical protein
MLDLIGGFFHRACAVIDSGAESVGVELSRAVLTPFAIAAF